MHLKLNPSKFNFIYLFKSKSLSSSLPPNMISDHTIYLYSTIHCLGFLLDSFLLLLVVFQLRRIRHISSYLDDAFLKLLVCSLVLSRLDYCNSLYFNLPKSTLCPLTKSFNLASLWSLLLLNYPISLHLLSIFTGYLFTFAFPSKSIFSCT